MIKLYKSNAIGVSALISDAGSKAACEAEIAQSSNQHLGRSLSFMYSKGVPFSILLRNQEAIFIEAGIPVITESEAQQIQAAFQA